MNKKKSIYFIIAILLIAGLIYFLSQRASSSSEKSVKLDNSEKINVSKPLKSKVINNEKSYPLKDSEGEDVSKFIYTIEKAELRDEIIVKGQKATAVKGQTILILYIKLKNEFDKGIQINTKDYVRLSVNGKDEWIAPDILNDPVEVQAISTKYSRLGFPINETDKDLKLQIGEIKGEKETIDVKFD